jgi:hypothetical protein
MTTRKRTLSKFVDFDFALWATIQLPDQNYPALQLTRFATACMSDPTLDVLGDLFSQRLSVPGQTIASPGESP